MPKTTQQTDLLQRSHDAVVKQVLDDNGKYFFERRKAKQQKQESKAEEHPEPARKDDTSR